MRSSIQAFPIERELLFDANLRTCVDGIPVLNVNLRVFLTNFATKVRHVHAPRELLDLES